VDKQQYFIKKVISGLLTSIFLIYFLGFLEAIELSSLSEETISFNDFISNYIYVTYTMIIFVFPIVMIFGITSSIFIDYLLGKKKITNKFISLLVHLVVGFLFMLIGAIGALVFWLISKGIIEKIERKKFSIFFLMILLLFPIGLWYIYYRFMHLLM
jgi:hypothetical protein